jgi:hypothetical protein
MGLKLMSNTKLLSILKEKWEIEIKDLSEEFKSELLQIVSTKLNTIRNKV